MVFRKTESELQKFIGGINNLEEALLIAKINGLWFDPENMKGGSYRKELNGYSLYLMKWEKCPETKESFKVFIDSKGHVTKENNGIYFRSGECYSH